MGTEVLRPQDCLTERIRVSPAVFPRRRSYGNYFNYNYNNNYATTSRSSRKPATRPEKVEQRKRVVSSQPVPESSVSKRSSSDDLRMGKGSLIMEKVTILRRGESLDSKIKSEALRKEGDDLVVCGTERLGPNPEMVGKQVRIMDVKSGLASVAVKGDGYAGSAFAVSPSPSALPLPSFSKKKQASAVVDDHATRDLRRLLRLE